MPLNEIYYTKKIKKCREPDYLAIIKSHRRSRICGPITVRCAYAGVGIIKTGGEATIINFSSDARYLAFNSITGYYAASFGNTNYAIFTGMQQYPTSSIKYSYPGNFLGYTGTLNQSRYMWAGTSTNETGYGFGGYYWDGSNDYYRATIEKYSYASETYTLSVFTLSTTRHYHATLGSPTVGYVSGGYNSGFKIRSTEKFTYATESRTFGGSLSTSRSAFAGCSNSTVGFYAGGLDISDSGLSSVEKYTFSSDTVTSGGNLSYSGYRNAACGNEELALFSYGATRGYSMYVRYSDNTKISASAILGFSSDFASGTSNKHGGLVF